VSVLPDIGEIPSAVFISDLHLAPGEDRQLQQFAQFLDGLKPLGVSALFVLGDLFDAWPGDDYLDEPFGQQVASLLKRVSDGGIDLYFMAGNRDFLLGEGFGEASGLRLLSDPTPVVIAGRAMLLSHGDLLCTDDVSYQRFREEVRGSAWQSRFLAQPLVERQRIVGDLRSASESAKAGKSDELMDVNQEAVMQWLRAHHEATLLHGHTHRPGRHDVSIDSRTRERWVLPDWEFLKDPPRGGGVLAKDGRLTMIGLDAKPI
jgi:UDP-2,3-diacylglucosamine hydrolase